MVSNNINSAAPFLEVKDLYKWHRNDFLALDGFSLSLESGDLTVLIGPSGCGKSTALRCLAGLEDIDSGEIYLNGIKVLLPEENVSNKIFKEYKKNQKLQRSALGMVFQNFEIFPHLKALENIVLGLRLVKRFSVEQSEYLGMEVLKKVGLAKKSHFFPWQMSGGQLQRLAIARTLAMEPKMILYDEPTSALDPELVDDILQIIKQLDKEGMTQLIVTHEMGFAKEVADNICFMYDGSILESGLPDSFFSQPKNPKTKAFLNRILD
jgi:polar amino acid transport system ATP-binding protein